MSLAVLGGVAARSRTLRLTECAPVAFDHGGLFRRDRQQKCTAETVSDVTDILTGAMLLANASEVLLPASVALAVHQCCATDRLVRARHAEACEDWLTMVASHKVRLLASAEEVHTILDQYPCFRHFCVAVPGGPLVSRLAFATPVDTFYAETVPGLHRRFAQAQDEAGAAVSWHAWMRSALTCRYEGPFVPPIRVSDFTAALLARDTDGGAECVVWEEGSSGLTPRWLETALKTAMACGVPASSLSLALCATAAGAPQTLAAKAIDMGVSRFCTCAASGAGLFTATDPLTPPSDMSRLAVAWNHTLGGDGTSRLSHSHDAAEDVDENLSTCDAYVQSVTDRFTSAQAI